MYRLCRSCLEFVSKTYPLIGAVANVDINIIDMLEYCTSRKLDLNDDLPTNVCIPCFKSIRITYNFLKQFEEAQLKLQEQIALETCKTSDNNEEYEFCQSVRTSDQLTEIRDAQYDLDSIHNYAVKLGNSNTTQISELSKYSQIIEVFAEDDKTEATSSYECNNVIKLEVKEPPLNHLLGLIKSEPADDTAAQNHMDGTQPNIESQQAEIANSTINYVMLQSSAKPIVINLSKNEVDVHNPTVSYRCPLCRLRLQNCQKFNSHVYSHRTNSVRCTWCPDKAQIPIDEYLYHYKQKHKYQCYICEKNLTSSYGYRYHMTQHESVKNYKCPVDDCSKSFLLFNILKRHVIEKHSDTKKYKCDKCHAAYGSYDTFRYHKKTHEGIKSHLCTICGKGFYQAVHLRDHMYRHTGTKSFTCDLCGFSVVTNSQLKKHQKYCSRKNSSSNKLIDD